MKRARSASSTTSPTRRWSTGAIDVSDGYSTDAKILAFNLLALRDDRGFFPPYEAAPLARADLFTRVPLAAPALRLLAGRIDDDTMRRLNYAVEGERRSPAEVAGEFLRQLGLQHVDVPPPARASGLLELLWQRRWITLELTARHLWLTGVAVLAAVLVGLPLGIAASRRPALAGVALTGAGVLQTIPSIALLAFMLPVFGIGVVPAIAALFLYGLLPILRNTVAGLAQRRSAPARGRARARHARARSAVARRAAAGRTGHSRRHPHRGGDQRRHRHARRLHRRRRPR